MNQGRHGHEGSRRRVIGADGLHSRVRKLVFGAQDRYEKDLGYRVAAFETTGYRPRDELVCMTVYSCSTFGSEK